MIRLFSILLFISALLVIGPGSVTLYAQDGSSVEELIRSDSVLVSLDHQLNEVYKAAQAKARDEMPKILRAEQHGWIKGRDDCWKAERGEEYLTASWITRGVRECVEGKYRLRISELQAIWQLVPSKGPCFYGCNGDWRNQIVATFYVSLLPTVRIERGDRTVLAWLTSTAGEGVYEGPDVTLVRTPTGVIVHWSGETLTCDAPKE